MKLNNKGFAITSVLYGLLILFVLLVGSYLTILTARKNRQDKITENIETKYYYSKMSGDMTLEDDFTAPYTGKYIFDNNEKCYIYLAKGSVLDKSDIILGDSSCNVDNGVNVYAYY